MEINRLCLGCMTEKGEADVCPRCGWTGAEVEESAIFLPPGTVLNGRYLIGRVLGYGGFGITYLTYDLNLQIKLAIKEYLPQSLATRVMGKTTVSVYSGDARDHFAYGLEKFVDEARMLAKFDDHPCIVSVNEYFKGNNTAYIVMSYIEGVTFKDYLKQKGGRIPYETAMEIMTPIMDALREVHSEGLLHRDISPDNIYITAKKQVKLLDFGAARYAVSEQSKSLSVILKPGYAPLEQYYSKGVQGPWTDVYAVAATIYRAITGEAPPEALERNEEDTLQPPSKLGVDIDAKAEMALMKAMAVKGKDRYQSIQEFQQAMAFMRSAGNGVKTNSNPCDKKVEEPPNVKSSRSEVEINESMRQASNKVKKQRVTKWHLIYLGAAVTGLLICFMVYWGINTNNNASIHTGFRETKNRSQVNKNIKVGDYVEFGSYLGKRILWRVMGINDGNPILWSENILCEKCFDAAESGMNGEGTRDSDRLGSNVWSKSNLREWLNSVGRVNWTTQPPTKEAVGDNNNYENEEGFLTGFTQAERGLLMKTQRNIKNESGKVLESTEDIIFLASFEEVKDGGKWGLNSGGRTKRFNGWNWCFLVNPCTGDSHSICTVTNDGKPQWYESFGSAEGVVPALQLANSSPVSGDGSKSNPWKY